MRIIKENAIGKKYIFKLTPDGKDQVYRTEQVFVNWVKEYRQSRNIGGHSSR